MYREFEDEHYYEIKPDNEIPFFMTHSQTADTEVCPVERYEIY